ncbi:hypothetical protein BSL78_18154 [Apostichopus japonicus]|uniref:ABC transporter domain-containing protein n=1 Tax=Stichopus japonicus TaxID=307972 RepID=A0A2G8KAF6_STIJA|nr:hypothetical protein BSL78_18154 [Apostichopus japonicus]
MAIHVKLMNEELLYACTQSQTILASMKKRNGFHGPGQIRGRYGTAKRSPSAVGEFEPVTISWRSLTVSQVDKKRSMFGSSSPKHHGKEILRNVSGIAEPGTLTAIMGSSGAGKTTLLHTLNNRLHGFEVTNGSILINGRPMGAAVAKISAYVQQNDMFMPCLRVKEHLTFQALLRMDPDIPYKTRFRRVDDVIRALGLTKCEDSIIGNPERGIKGISGGERKRLSFASELLTNPPLLFCDEPTSGLDSFMAQSVVETLRTLASEGRTILTTIHQPSSEVFQLFDRIGYTCPKNYNPADFIVETLGIVPGMEAECHEKLKEITDAFDNSRTAEEILLKITPMECDDMEEENEKTSPYKASWWNQMKACTWRAGLSGSRDPFLTTVCLFKVLVVAGIISLIFFQTDPTQDGIQNINGCIFLLVVNSAFTVTMQQCKVFPLELTLVKREHFNGMYRIDVYFLAKLITDFPFGQCFLPALSMTIVYWLVGLYPAIPNYLIAVGFAILLVNSAVSFGYLMSALSPTIQLALSITPPTLLPFLLLGGLFLNLGNLPLPLQWLSYGSWIRVAFEGLLINQWTNHPVTDCPVNSTSPCFPDGESVLEYFSFSSSNMYGDVIALFAQIIGYRLATLGVLWCRCYRKGH